MTTIKYNKGPAKKRGNSFKLTKGLSDQIKERMQIIIKDKTGILRGFETILNSSFFNTLNPQNIKPIITKREKVRVFIGLNMLIILG